MRETFSYMQQTSFLPACSLLFPRRRLHAGKPVSYYQNSFLASRVSGIKQKKNELIIREFHCSFFVLCPSAMTFDYLLEGYYIRV